ncbi:MAG: hypothetical protein NTV97_35630 [Alphaproteobacteria bacterium]|nr:hypothetical protein [Alphaproteobacteria bacterium]
MPVEFTIDHATRFVHARAHGIVTLQELEPFMDAVVVQDAMGYRKLFDGRDAIGKYTSDDVMMLGARISAYATMGVRGPLALVAAGGDGFEVASRFINLGKNDRAAKVFLEVDEARKWLDDQPLPPAP